MKFRQVFLALLVIAALLAPAAVIQAADEGPTGITVVKTAEGAIPPVPVDRAKVLRTYQPPTVATASVPPMLTPRAYFPLVLSDWMFVPPYEEKGLFAKFRQGGNTPPNQLIADLWKYDGKAWVWLAKIRSDASGKVATGDLPSLNPGQAYEILWINNSGDSSKMSVWYSKIVQGYRTGDDVDLGVIDLQNVQLLTPPHTATVVLPGVFTWKARFPNEVYRFVLWDMKTNGLAESEKVTTTSYTLYEMPQGWSFGVYGWFVRVDDGSGGFFESFYYHQGTLTDEPPPTVTQFGDFG